MLLYVGELNRRCFEDYGGRPEQLVHAPQVVDNARFAGEWARYAPRCGSLKLAFGIAPRQKVCIFCGKFIASKQPLVLLEAFLDANLGDQWVLLMVGDGPLRAPCEARAAERGATSRVVFAGFLDQNEIGRAFAMAEILVLPSTSETWGLVVNEAMNFRCAIIVSDAVGCAPDLVADKCGLVFPHDSSDALVDALKRMAGDDELRSAFAERAQAVIAQWSVAGLRLWAASRTGPAGLRRSMKILHVIPTLAPQVGGPPKACYEMARSMARRGHTVSIQATTLNTSEPNIAAFGKVEERDGVAIYQHPVRYLRSWAYSPGLVRCLRETIPSVDIVHLHSLYLFPTQAAGRECARSSVPYILHPHGSLDTWHYRRKRWKKKPHRGLVSGFRDPFRCRCAICHGEREAGGAAPHIWRPLGGAPDRPRLLPARATAAGALPRPPSRDRGSAHRAVLRAS